MSRTLNEFKAAFMCGFVIIVIGLFNTHGKLNIGNAIIGMLMIDIVAVLSLRIKAVIPFKLPAFAWASLLGLIVTTPWCPISKIFLQYTSTIGFGPIGTVILAAAGVSIGTKLEDVKRLSWRIILVSLVVFTGTFFGSALIAEAILKYQGLI